MASERSAYFHESSSPRGQNDGDYKDNDDYKEDKDKISKQRFKYLKKNYIFIIGGSIMVISAFMIGNISSRMRK
jgi:hypothetical protein